MKYYLYRHGNERLFEKKQLKMLAIRRDDLVKEEGGESWIEAEKVPELKDLFTDSETTGSTEEYSAVNEFHEEGVQRAEAPELEDLPVKSENKELVFYNPFNSNLKVSRRWLYIGLGVLFLVIMAATNPSKAKHYDKVETMICTSIVNNGYDNTESSLANYLVSAFVSNIVNKSLAWHDCILFSYTNINEELYRERNIVTFGIFGHVFSVSQEKVDKYIGNLKNSIMNGNLFR